MGCLEGGMVGGTCVHCFACIDHISPSQDFVHGWLKFGDLYYSLKCGDKEVLGEECIGFQFGIGCGESIGKGALAVFLQSGSSCGVLGIPVGGLW